MNLLRILQASEISVGRFPDQVKDEAPREGWVPLEPESPVLLVRAKGKFGFLIGKSVAGHFPSWTRVFLSQEELEIRRQNELATENEIRLRSLTGDTVAESMKAWRQRYPRKVTIAASLADDLRRFMRAEKAGDQQAVPVVTIDLRRGVICADSVMSIELPIEMLDTLDYPEDRDGDQLVRVRASYLADAIEYLGDSAEWSIASTTLVGHQGALGAVLMPYAK
jgi:hypothetical protein